MLSRGRVHIKSAGRSGRAAGCSPNSGAREDIPKPPLRGHPSLSRRRVSVGLEPEITQARMIIGPAAKGPVIFAFVLADRQVIYAGDAPAHQTLGIEFPVLIAITAKPVAAVIVPFVGKTHRDTALAECPDFFDQTVVELAAPFAL